MFTQDTYISREEAAALMDKNPDIREIVTSAEIKHSIENNSLLPRDEARRFAELANKGRTRTQWGFWHDKGEFGGEANVIEYQILYQRDQAARRLLNQYVQDSRSLNPEQIDRLSMILYRASGNNLERARAIIESERDSVRHGSVDNLNAIEAKESAYQNAKLLDDYYRSPS